MAGHLRFWTFGDVQLASPAVPCERPNSKDFCVTAWGESGRAVVELVILCFYSNKS